MGLRGSFATSRATALGLTGRMELAAGSADNPAFRLDRQIVPAAVAARGL